MEKRMKRYEKISSGSGSHGVKYEINLLIYYLLKAYRSKEKFQLSNGKKDKLKLDDIIVESDSYIILAQAKHIDNESKKITKSQLFSESGKFSLNVYLQVAYEIFQKFLCDIQKQLAVELFGLQENDPSPENFERKIVALQKRIQIDSFCDETFQCLLFDLKELNLGEINSILESFQKTEYHLVTNISPNDELSEFSSMCSLDRGAVKNFAEITEYYNFNTDNSKKEIMKLEGKSNIPKWFIGYFMKKFILIIISNETLKGNIENLLKLSCSDFEILNEIAYTDIYELIEEWQSKRSGVYLTRDEVDKAYLAYILNKLFLRDLKAYENCVELDLEPLLKNVSDHLLTIVISNRYFLIMTALQKKFKEEQIVQTLFVNPFSTLDKQKFLMQAFLHRRFIYLVCVLQDKVEELTLLLADIVGSIEENTKFLGYKKIIIFCSKKTEIHKTENKIIVDDHWWYEKRKLSISRIPNCLGSTENYYINRELTCNNIKMSEGDFINHITKKRNTFIISDSAGMGKTTLLLSLSVKINNENYYWSIIIHLNKFTDLFEKHSENGTVPDLDEFLNKFVVNSFERQICNIPNIIILMVDGFDEVSPDYNELVIKFLDKAASAQNVLSILITTRKHLKEQLEKKMKFCNNRQTYELVPLNDFKIRSLLGKLKQQSSDEVNKWYNLISKNNSEFFAIPLHVKMFAESSQFEKALATNSVSMNLYKLYDDFVNEKKEIFIKEKCNSQGNIHVKKTQNIRFTHLLDILMEVAVEMTFKEELLKALGLEVSSINIVDEELCATGILEYTDMKIFFVHETFKEFFVAKWIMRKLLNVNENSYKEIEVIFKNILMKSYGFKQFINSFLEHNWNRLSEENLIIYSDIISGDKIFSDILFVNFDYTFIIRFMVEKCENVTLLNRYFEDIINLGSDHLLDTDLILLFIKKGVKSNKKTDKGKTLLHVVAERGSLDLVKYLIEKKFCKIDKKDKLDLTPIMLALLEGNFEIFDYLISHGASRKKLRNKINFVYNGNNRSLLLDYYKFGGFGHQVRMAWGKGNCLHIAIYKGNLDLIKFIIDNNICNIHDRASDSSNILHCAARTGNLEVIKYLVTLNIEINEKTEDGDSLLHLAVMTEDINLIDYIVVELGVKIDAVNNSGATALYISCIYCSRVVVKYLLEMHLKFNIPYNDSVDLALSALFYSRNYTEFCKLVLENYKDEMPIPSKCNLMADAISSDNIDLENYFTMEHINASEQSNKIMFDGY